MHRGLVKTKLVEKVHQDQINKQELLETKLLGANKDFRAFYDVR